MLSKLAQTLLRLRRRYKPRKNPADPRILVIRRNRMGDMIYTLPLLHALRRHYPRAHIAVACDPPGAPIAGACAAVNEVIVLERSRLSVIARIKNAARLQKFDWVVAAKGRVRSAAGCPGQSNGGSDTDRLCAQSRAFAGLYRPGGVARRSLQ